MHVSYVWHSFKWKYNRSTLVVEAHIKPHAHIWLFDQSNQKSINRGSKWLRWDCGVVLCAS